MDRRAFLSGAATILAAPAIVTSAHAQTRQVRVRRNVQDMKPDDAFFSDYAQAVEAMHRQPAGGTRSWQFHALIHRDSCPHGQEDFFHWHRHYITYFERLCGELIGKPDFALAYWDWTRAAGRIPEPFYDLKSLNVESWNDPSDPRESPPRPGEEVSTIGARGLARGVGLQDVLQAEQGGPFSEKSISDAMGLSTFSNFITTIEGGPHGTGHTITGDLPDNRAGHMSRFMSPLDPIFWLHHCNVDRLWEEWRNIPGHTTPAMSHTYTNQFVRTNGERITRTAAQALDMPSQGFTYDTMQRVASAQGGDRRVASARAAVRAPAPAVPAIAGRSAQAITAAVGATSVASVPVRAVAPAASAPRSPAAARSAAGGGGGSGRILLRLNNVRIDKDEGRVLVKVLVGAGRADRSGASASQYSGTFSLFGNIENGHAGHAHGSAPRSRSAASAPTAAGTTRLVDITDAVARLSPGGRLNADQLSVELQPVTGAKGGSSTAKVTVGSFDIVRD